MILVKRNKIHFAPTSYYVNAGLYSSRFLSHELDTESTTTLAAIFLGYVRFLGREALISG